MTVRLPGLVACYRPKRGLGPLLTAFPVDCFLSAITRLHSMVCKLMTSGLRHSNFWTLKTLNVSSVISGNYASWKLGWHGW